MTKKFNIIWFVWNVVEILMIFVAAAICISYVNGQDVWKEELICWLLGLFITLSGALRLGTLIIGRRKLEASSIFVRSMQAAAGISLITLDFTATVNFVLWFTAMFLIVLGVVFVALGITKVHETKRFNIIAFSHFFTSGVMLILGILLTVFCMMIYVKKSWTLGVEGLLFVSGILAALFGILKTVTVILVMIKAVKTGENVIDIISKPKKTTAAYETIEDNATEAEQTQMNPIQEDAPVEPMVEDTEDPNANSTNE